MTAAIVDSHCHVWWSRFDEDRDEVIARAREAGVERMVVVGTTPRTSREALELAAKHDGLYGTAGIHPHDSEEFTEESAAEIRALCERDDCVAVGETGLDWFKEWAPRESQLDAFRWHLELARELGKPVVIHSRDAHEDTARLVTDVPGVRGVMHCYAMGPDELPAYLDAGLAISFSGIVTYPKNEGVREAARVCPEDRILVETDAPFLAPVPHRGKRNEPAFCADTLRAVAEIRGVDPSDLARATSRNAERLFGLDAR
ncbi:MAG: TatD family hydrolase [Planctomycetota bacterium]